MTFQQQKSFLYAAYREQFLELIEAQEYQKAFTHLAKRLKPLETSAASVGEFKDLCYLLTCRSVHEVLPQWQGAAAAREALLTQFATMLEMEERWQEGTDGVALPERRLLELLEQAAAFQVSRSLPGERAGHGIDAAAATDRVTANGAPAAAASEAAGAHVRGASAHSAGNAFSRRAHAHVTSLLSDYASPCVPNTPHLVLKGHADGVKSVAWLRDSSLLLSAGNDQVLRLWSVREGAQLAVLEGHAARIWQVAVSQRSQLVASASADGTVRLWRVGETSGGSGMHAVGGGDGPEDGGGSVEARVSYAGTLSGHSGDVYSVGFHPHAEQMVTAGCARHATAICMSSRLRRLRHSRYRRVLVDSYDRSVRLFDAAVGVEQRTLVGHELPAREAVFNATGNLVVSGGKDATVRFWDVRSALCVRKLQHSLGEITSVQLSQCGTQLLASSKDNAIRLWDVRAARPLHVYKGHQNTSKNFVRARFGPARDLVLSGSEDGSVRAWPNPVDHYCSAAPACGVDGACACSQICLWNLSSAALLHKLRGHTNVAYDVAWSSSQGLLASCSHDGTVRTWQYDQMELLTPGDAQVGW